MTHVLRFALVLVAISAAACGRTQDTEPPVATPTVALARTEAALGTPLEMKYRFAVAQNAPAFDEDYWVFVHFVDADGELMWTDDHQPATPTRQWKPGATIEYERTLFVPKFPYTGQTIVEIGLFSPRSGQRLPLNADTEGQRSYVVASFNLRHQDENRFVVFRDGWHPTEVADDEAATEWQWSKKEATLTFRNPKRDVVFYLQLDRPGPPAAQPTNVQIRIGGAVVDSFTVASDRPEVRKFPINAAQLGDADVVQMTISVDRTFVAANIPELKSRDVRELGVRVFRAHLEPR